MNTKMKRMNRKEVTDNRSNMKSRKAGGWEKKKTCKR